MIFRKSLLLIGIVMAAFVLGACSKKETATVSSPPGSGLPNPGIIDVVKRGKLASFPSTTIGDAFDSYRYMTKKEWNLKQEGNVFTVDFLGWVEPDSLTAEDLKAGLTGKGIDVKFVIEPSGAYYAFMALKLEAKSDGKIYTSPYSDMNGILASIYANKKIDL